MRKSHKFDPKASELNFLKNQNFMQACKDISEQEFIKQIDREIKRVDEF